MCYERQESRQKVKNRELFLKWLNAPEKVFLQLPKVFFPAFTKNLGSCFLVVEHYHSLS